MFGDKIKEFEKYSKELKKKCVKGVLEVMETATIEAINTAVNYTPPKKKTTTNKGYTTGDMADSWNKDSIRIPFKESDKFVTILKNNKDYASYVNDGHRVDEHFVPHLFNIGGKLIYKADVKGGIKVGTKTKYVKGLYMKEKALVKYHNVLRREIERLFNGFNESN